MGLSAKTLKTGFFVEERFLNPLNFVALYSGLNAEAVTILKPSSNQLKKL